MLKRNHLFLLPVLFGLLFTTPTVQASAIAGENAKSTQTTAVRYPSQSEIEAMNATDLKAFIEKLEGAYENEGDMPDDAFLALSIARGQSGTIEQDAETDRKRTMALAGIGVAVIYSAGVLYYFEKKKN